MESRGEASELQQLVSSDADGENDSTIQDESNVNETEGKTVSPVRSNRVGVCNASNKMHVGIHTSFFRYPLQGIPVTVLSIV